MKNEKGAFSNRERQIPQRAMLWLRGPQGLFLAVILLGLIIYGLASFFSRQEADDRSSLAAQRLITESEQPVIQDSINFADEPPVIKEATTTNVDPETVVQIPVQQEIAGQESVSPQSELPSEKGRQSDLDRILATDNVRDLYIASSNIQASMNEVELPAQILAIKAQMAIAERLDEIATESDDDARDTAQIIRLRALIYWDRLNREHKLPNSEQMVSLRDYASSLLSNDNSEIVKEARLALTFSYCDEFARTQNEEALDQFISHADKLAAEYVDDQESMLKLYEMVKIVCLAHTELEANHKEVLRRFGDVLLKSEQAIVRQVGGQLHDLTIVGKSNYEDLLYKMSYGDRSAIDRAKQIVAGTSSTDKLSSGIFFHGIEFAELLQQQGQDMESNKLHEQLENALSTQSEATQSIAGPLLEKFDRRTRLVGTTFELSATETDGSNIDFSDYVGKPVVVVFMSVDDKSRDTMSVISEMASLHKQGIRFVCVAVKPNLRALRSLATNPADANRIAVDLYAGLVRRLQFAQFVPVAGAQRLLEQCPMQTPPYVLILDDSHKVIARNVRNDDIRSTIESSAPRN